MLNSHEKTKIKEQAIDWLLLIEEQALSVEQLQEFEQWKNSSPFHQETWQRVNKVKKKLDSHQQNVSANLAKNILIQEHAPPWTAILTVLLASGSVLGFTLYLAQQQAWLADHRTVYAEQQRIQLEDGTHISLSSKTAIDVNYTGTERQVILRYGEIYVETAKDTAQRPFKVLNRHGEMLALGTAFNVQQKDDLTTLIVTEHAVQISTDQSKQKQTIQAGQQIGFSADKIYPIQEIQFEQLSWRKGLVTVNRMQVKDFTKLITQHYGVTVQIDSATSGNLLQQIEISGSYPINDLDRMIELLENTYPMIVQKTFFNRKLMITSKQ